MTWKEINPLEPLPTGEVLVTDSNGKYLLGELGRASLSNIYCIGQEEELSYVTHYCILESPAFHPRPERIPVSKAPDMVIPEEERQLALVENEEEITPISVTNKPLRRKYYRAAPGEPSRWEQFINLLIKLPLNYRIHKSEVKGIELIKNQACYFYFLKKRGYIKIVGAGWFVVLKEIPHDIHCSLLGKRDEKRD